MADVLVISGLSGAGRSEAAGVLEDLGWYVVDNLPTSLVGKIVELASAPGSAIDQLALVAGRQHNELLDKLTALRGEGHAVNLLFLEADTPTLVRRYESTRRRHPLAGDAEGVLEAIERERRLLEPVRAAADLVIDTTNLNVHELKARLINTFEPGADRRSVQLAIGSFGFKRGLPLDADIVMDVRFLPNPHWIEELRPLAGFDPAVRDYVLGQPEAAAFLDRFEQLLLSLLPSYDAEGKSYLTVAIGCTGGRHRSVAIAEELTSRLSRHGYAPRCSHRDVGRSS